MQEAVGLGHERVQTNSLMRQLGYVIVGLTSLYVLYQLGLDVSSGGNAWKQGDWLIHSREGLVRRFLMGDVALWFSEVFRISPVYVVAALQAGLFICLIGLFLSVGRNIPEQTFLLIACSPAYFLIFWAADPQGSLRKELILFVAIFLMLRGIWLPSKAALWGGWLLAAIAFFSHEGLVLFLPTVSLLIGFYASAILTLRERVLYVASLGFCALSALLFAVVYSAGAGGGAVCSTLLESGVGEHVCDGAVNALDWSSGYGVSEVAERFGDNFKHHLYFFVLYCWALLPFYLIVKRYEQFGRKYLILVCLVLPFLPLYWVALDFGRWMSFHIFSMAALVIAHELTRSPSIAPWNPKKNAAIYLLAAISALLVSPRHTLGVEWLTIFREFRHAF